MPTSRFKPRFSSSSSTSTWYSRDSSRVFGDEQRRAGAWHTDADAATGQATHHQCLEAVAELAGVLDPGVGSDARVAAVGAWDEDEPAVAFAGRLRGVAR